MQFCLCIRKQGGVGYGVSTIEAGDDHASEFNFVKSIFERCNINFEYDNYYSKILQY